MPAPLFSQMQVLLRAAAIQLRQEGLPSPQVRSAVQNVDQALVVLAQLQAELEAAEGTITLAMLSAGYDATRLADGTPQHASTGFVLGSSAAIYAAMRGAMSTPSTVAVTFTLQDAD